MQYKSEKIDIQDLQKQIELLQEEKSELVSRIRDLSLRDREKSVQIRILFDNLPYGVVMFDEDRNIVQINQSAAELFGYEKRQLIGRNCTEVMDCYERHLSCPVLDGEQSLNQVRTGCFKCDKTLLRSAVQNKGADGVVIVESFGDITELERATMAKTLALQTKSNFLSNISHELRTPMHGIIGFAELLSLDSAGLNERAQSNIKELRQSASSLWKLLEKLFQAASLEENSLQVHAARFDFAVFIADFEKEIRLAYSGSGNELVFDIDSSVTYITTDELKLHQVLMGLLENAIKYTDNGRIELNIQFEQQADVSYLNASIRDNGIGITPQKQREIFDLFEQEDGSSTRSYQGAGLGLAISKQLALLMGGDITLQSEPGKGSVFNLRLPV